MDKKIKINKQKLILISVILVLLVVIITIIVKTVSDRKSEQVYAKQDKIQNLYENSEENDILLVNVEENVVLENQVIENEVVEIKTEEPKTSNTGKTKYKLEVNCEQNVVNVYTKDANGEYTNCVKAMLCSVGPATPTSGTYSLKNMVDGNGKAYLEMYLVNMQLKLQEIFYSILCHIQKKVIKQV